MESASYVVYKQMKDCKYFKRERGKTRQISTSAHSSNKRCVINIAISITILHQTMCTILLTAYASRGEEELERQGNGQEVHKAEEEKRSRERCSIQKFLTASLDSDVQEPDSHLPEEGLVDWNWGKLEVVGRTSTN